MKKLILLSLTILFFSCGESDSNSSNNTSINPPSWIQGVWTNESVSQYYRLGFEFKVDDLCTIFYNIATCNKEILNQLGKNQYVNVQENISANRYAIDITNLSYTTSYVFEKINNNKIIQKNATTQGTDVILTRE